MKVNVHDLAEQNMYLVAMHLPSERRISKSFPKYIEEFLAGEEEVRLVRGYFYNQLHRLNEKARSIATKYGVRVDPAWYLMNETGLQKFLRDLEKLKVEYDEYQEMLNDFLIHGIIPKFDNDRVKIYPEYTEKIKKYLSERKVEIRPVSITDGILVNVLPLHLDEKTLARVADERLAQELRKTAAEIAKKVEEDIKERIEALDKKLKNAKSIMHLPNARDALLEEIENVQEICSSYGIELPESVQWKINSFYRDLEKKALDSITTPRAKALMKKILQTSTTRIKL